MRYEAWQSSGGIEHDTVHRVNYGTVDRRAYPTPPQPSPEGEGATLNVDSLDRLMQKALLSGEGLVGVSSRADHRAYPTPPQPSPEWEGATLNVDSLDQLMQKALPSGEGLGGVGSIKVIGALHSMAR